jgi:hypothetical protein
MISTEALKRYDKRKKFWDKIIFRWGPYDKICSKTGVPGVIEFGNKEIIARNFRNIPKL